MANRTAAGCMLFGAVLGGPAAAQQPAPAPGAAQSTAGDIVVSARRRDERLSDVPVATSVLTAADQANLVLDNMQDFLRQTPGALIVNAGPDYFNDISIRGQGGGRSNTSESAAGIYRNGIYVAGGGFGGRSFNRLDYFDNERVEVFRGPQGALYGRSAVGGAVNVVSRRPADEMGGWADLEYTDAERITARAIVNLGLTDDTALRFGGFTIDQRGGDIRDVNRDAIIDDQRYHGLRVAGRTRFAEGWELRGTYEYYESDAPSFSALGQRVNPPAPGRVVDPGPFERNASFVGRVRINENTGIVELDGDLGFADLALVYVHKSRKAARQDDLDHFLGLEGIPGVEIFVDQTGDFTRNGAEVRLTSPAGTGRISWLLGLDWQETEEAIVTANSGRAPPGSAFGIRNQIALRNESDERLRSWSVFGLLDWRIDDRWTAAVEARFQRDSKDFLFSQRSLNPPVEQRLSPAWTQFLPAASLSYRVGPAQTVYGRVATAYRPGGFNPGVVDPTFLAYDPEKTAAVELGFKGRVPDTRLFFELVGYHNWNKDMQLVTSASLTDSTSTLQNAGDARLWGLEASIGGRTPVGSGGLNWNIAAAHQNGRFADGSSLVIQGRTVDLSGVRVNRTRDLILNVSAFLDQNIAPDLELFGGGSLRLERGGFENATGGSDDPSGRPLDNYELVDLRGGIRGNGWSISLFAQNVFDQVYLLSQILNNNYWNQRRRVGIEARVSFGGERAARRPTR